MVCNAVRRRCNCHSRSHSASATSGAAVKASNNSGLTTRSCLALRACRRDNRPALCADLPESLVRLQRRENCRIQTPMGKPAQATIPLDGTAGNSSVRIPLFDISCGGVALIEEAAVLDATIGHEYPQCRIDLPGIGVIDATLEVRDSHEFTLRNGAWRRRIGCQFKNPSSSVLTAINRYIMKLERELNARRADLE